MFKIQSEVYSKLGMLHVNKLFKLDPNFSSLPKSTRPQVMTTIFITST
jgi:hypothetical protein